MTTGLGLAAVTATLRELLSDGIIDNNVNGMLGTTVSVSVLPPDKVVPQNGTEAAQLNLFLYQVTANAGWRNEGLPSRDAASRRLSNPPLALDLHYLLSAYTAGDLNAELLLGYAMHWLHERPVLTRDMIRAALTPSPAPGTPLDRALQACGLADQVELIKITPEYLNTEEMSKLWTATQSHLRPTAAYVASVVLIEASALVASPLPVLTRGPVDPASGHERGVIAEASLDPALPTLEAVTPDGGQPVARLGQVIDLTGHHLDGAARTVLLGNDRFEIEQTIAALPGGEGRLMQFSIPVLQATDFPVGVYRVGAQVVRPGETDARQTNRLAMTLAPEITGLPISVMRDVSGAASFSLNFNPALRPGQTVSLVLGLQEFAPQAFAAPCTTLNFVIGHAPIGSHLARLRIDGIDSPIVDHSVSPPVFRNQRVVIS